jgi:hypothetical protein
MDELEQLRQRYLNGDKSALLEALYLCVCIEVLEPPWWLKAEFYEAYNTVHGAKARSWDDVFGKPWSKGARLPDMRRRGELAPHVFMTAMRLHTDHGLPIDDGLFERTGELVGCGARQAKELYYKIDKREPIRNYLIRMLRSLPSP